VLRFGCVLGVCQIAQSFAMSVEPDVPTVSKSSLWKGDRHKRIVVLCALGTWDLLIPNYFTDNTQEVATHNLLNVCFRVTAFHQSLR
jgi:hypothetical protein